MTYVACVSFEVERLYMRRYVCYMSYELEKLD